MAEMKEQRKLHKEARRAETAKYQYQYFLATGQAPPLPMAVPNQMMATGQAPPVPMAVPNQMMTMTTGQTTPGPMPVPQNLFASQTSALLSAAVSTASASTPKNKSSLDSDESDEDA